MGKRDMEFVDPYCCVFRVLQFGEEGGATVAVEEQQWGRRVDEMVGEDAHGVLVAVAMEEHGGLRRSEDGCAAAIMASSPLL